MKIPKELEHVFRGVELTEDEIRTLTWVTGWEHRTVENLRSAIQKVRATAISTLQAENARLRAYLEHEREHANAYHEECGQWEAENEKLREAVDKYATAARAIALHLKPFCDESLPYDEMIADAARKASYELERVKAERDAAVSWAQKYTESIDMPCVACKHNTGDYVCTAICGNCGPMGAESCKWEFDFSGELKED